MAKTGYGVFQSSTAVLSKPYHYILTNKLECVKQIIGKTLNFFNFSVRMADMKHIMEGLTIKEMAEKLGITPNTVKQRLFQRGIKPFCKDALYEPSALDQISDFGPKGFQPKPLLESTDKADKPKKSGKSKK